MELTYSPASPFVRMVVVTAHETGMMDQITLTPVATTAFETSSDVAAANPLGRIPALTRPDGGALYDSRVICRYLDDRAGGTLYPDSALWDVLTLEATGQGIADSAVSMAYERRLRDPAEQSDRWVEAQWTKIARTLDALESRWMSHLYGPFGAGHIAVGCALSYVDLRHSDRNWRATRPSLAAWHGKTEDRASFKATHPQG